MSAEENPSDESENSTLSAVQELILSIGQLKFSMRAISSMHLQSALLSVKESESTPNLEPLESNRLLENIITEISASKADQCDQNTEASKDDKSKSSVSIDDLEIIQKKLQDELELRRQRYLESISKKYNV